MLSKKIKRSCLSIRIDIDGYRINIDHCQADNNIKNKETVE